MNELQNFTNSEFGTIRTTTINNEPYFFGKDVAEVLGYANSRKAIADHIDEEDKGVTICDTPGGKQEVTIINESGLYSLIMSSKLPSAKKFKRWVTSEVLPAIRKHGIYADDNTIEKMLSSPDFGIRLLTELKREREEKHALIDKIKQDKDKVLFAEAVTHSEDCILIGELAKLISQNGVKTGQNNLFEWLRNNNYLCSYGDRYNQPTQRYVNSGYFKVKERTVINKDGSSRLTFTTTVTPKGQIYFINKFLSN